LYERKRGEFGDGLNKGYINQSQILERNLFFRIFHASNGDINTAVTKRIFLKHKICEAIIFDEVKLSNFYFGYLLFNKLSIAEPPNFKRDRPLFGRIYAMTRKYKPTENDNHEESIADNLPTFLEEWKAFIEEISKNNTKYLRTFIDKETQLPRSTFNTSKWLKSNDFTKDVKSYFG
jgi:hypothetical protein